MEIDVVFNVDCIEGMKQLPDKCIDFIFTDLPYGTTCCKWDSVIPFEPLWEQYNRIIKDNAAIALFAQEPFAAKLRASNLKMYKYDWIWQKEQGKNFLNCNKQPLKNYEIICIFGKGRLLYNPQMTSGKPYTTSNVNNDEVFGGNYKKIIKHNKGTRYPTSIQKFNSVPHSKRYHATQKPIDLLEYFIKTYTNENAIVLDSCCGSGSTLIAAINTNRHFVGYEKDKHYFDITCQRINEKRG